MNNSKLKVMQTLLMAFCLAIISFAGVSLLLKKDDIYFDPSTTSDQTGFYPLFPIIGLALILLGLSLFNKLASKLPEDAAADEKIEGYQSAFIIRSAFLEAASLMNIVGFLLSGNIVFLVIPVIAIAALILTRPTKENVINTLSLSYPDTEKL